MCTPFYFIYYTIPLSHQYLNLKNQYTLESQNFRYISRVRANLSSSIWTRKHIENIAASYIGIQVLWFANYPTRTKYEIGNHTSYLDVAGDVFDMLSRIFFSFFAANRPNAW